MWNLDQKKKKKRHNIKGRLLGREEINKEGESNRRG
jgi:hypothetical protein